MEGKILARHCIICCFTISRWIFGGKMRVHRPNNSSVPANTAITYPFYLFSLPFFSLNNSIEEIDLPIEFDLSSK